jgi:flagellar basal-body rod protein FlgB
MAILDIPIFSMLRTRMAWHQERQKVLAENVANADTAHYRAQDLAPPKFEIGRTEMVGAKPGVTLARTESGHINGVGLTGSPFRTESKGRFEIRPSGNAVNLEDQMMKVASNQLDYQAATAVYTRSLNLLKTALGKR